MAVDRGAVLESAQAFTAKGQYDKAIAEWRKLLTGTPADGTIQNTIGDLHLKRNASADAVEAYFQAATAFRAENGALKAIALYKKILKVDPSRYQAYRCLGDVNAERGLVGNAVADYLTLAKLHAKAGRKDEEVEAYKLILAVDPSNAEAAQRMGAEPAAPAAKGTGGPEAGGGPEKSAAASSAAASAESGSVLPQIYTRQGYLDEANKLMSASRLTDAETVLNEILSREPGDPEVCRLLASLHLKQGNMAYAKAEFQFLAEAAMRAQDFVLAESMLVEYLNADPTSVSLRQLLGRLYEQSGDGKSAAIHYGEAIRALLETPDPEQPELPQELYERILLVAPDSQAAKDYAGKFSGTGGPAVAPDMPVASAPALTQPVVAESVSSEPEQVREEPARHETAEATPEAASRTSGSFRFTPSMDSAPSVSGASAESAGSGPGPAARKSSGGAPFRLAASRDAEGASAGADMPAPTEAATGSSHDEAAAGLESVPAEALAEPMPVFAGGMSAGTTSGTDKPASVPPGRPPTAYRDHFELGQAFRLMGLTAEAVEAMETALQGEEHLPDPARLRYELGLLYEAAGSADRALDLFSTIAGYEDVSDRIPRLKQDSASEPSGEVVAVAEGGMGSGPSAGPDKKKRRISYL